MEKFTKEELEKLRTLQAKQKRIQRAEADFWKDVSERREEVLAFLAKQEPAAEPEEAKAQLGPCDMVEASQNAPESYDFV